MFKKITTLGALLTILFLPSFEARAGMVDWITGQNKEWTFDHVYKSITGEKQGNQSQTIQESEVTETPLATLPSQIKRAAIREVTVTATAYSSTVDQTDDTPFITAWGTTVRDGIVAANFLPFGTIIRIPDIYGNKEFTVEDRMNKRYWHRVDIWFPERQMAKEFGIKQIRVEIVS